MANISERKLKDGRRVFDLTWYTGRVTERLVDGETVKVRERVKETIDGPPVRTKTQAKQYWTERLSMLRKRGPVQAPKITIAQFATRWLRDYGEVSLKASTFKSYKSIIDRHIIPALGDIAVAELTIGAVRTFVSDVMKKTTWKGKEGSKERREVLLSPRRVAYIRQVLRGIMAAAVTEEMIATNPVEPVKPPRQDPKPVRAFTEAEARAIEDSTRGAAGASGRWRTLFGLAWRTGVRLGELLAVTWDDLDLDDGTLFIHRTLSKDKDGSLVFGPPKSKKSVRTVILPPGAVRLLRAHLEEQAAKRAEAGTSWQVHHLVFCTRTGLPIAERNAQRAYYRFRDRARVSTLGFHSSRHTFATLQRARGIDIADISDALGHESPAFTAKQYAHGTTASQRAAAEKWARSLGEGDGRSDAGAAES